MRYVEIRDAKAIKAYKKYESKQKEAMDRFMRK